MLKTGRKLLVVVVWFLIGVPFTDTQAQSQRQVNIGFFEAGECLGHVELRNEYLRQLERLLPEGIDVVTIPDGYRSAGWKRDTCRNMAAELTGVEHLDLVVTLGPWVVEDLLATGFEKPIVAMNRVDPVAEGLLASDGHPVAPNLTAHVRPSKIVSDLQMLSRLVETRRLGVLYFPTGNERDTILSQIRQAGRKLGFEVTSSEAFNKHGTFAYFKAYQNLDKKIDALYLFPFWDMDAVKVKEFLAMVSRDQIPTIVWGGRYLVDRGAFVSNTGYSAAAEARFNAVKTVRIINGETPDDLPVFYDCPTGLTINEGTAKQCGIELSEEVKREAQVVVSPPLESTEQYTFQGALHRAIDRNPGYLSHYEALESAVQAARQALTAYLPRLEAHYSVTHFDNNAIANSSGTIDENRYAGEIVLEQTIFSLEAIRSISTAAKKKTLEQVCLKQAQLDLELAVTLVYLNYLEAEETLSLMHANRNQIDRYLELSQARFDVESESKIDVIRWQQERHRATADIMKARNKVAITRVLLNSIFNLPGDKPFILDTTLFCRESFIADYHRLYPLIASRSAQTKACNFLVGEALQTNQMVNTFERRIDLQASLLDQNKARYSPTANLRAWLGHVDELADQPPDFHERKNSWSVTGKITLPLFLGTDRIREHGKLKARLSELEYLRDDVILGVMREVLNEFQRLLTCAETMHKNVEIELLARENLTLVISEYESGKLPLVDATNAQNNILNAKLATIVTRYEYYALQAKLAHDIGWSAYDRNLPPAEIFFSNLREYFKVDR